MGALTRERLGDGIEVLRLDRPEVRNAMDTALLVALGEALTELAADATLRVLVIATTNERALCAGADVAEELDPAGGVARMELFAALYSAIEASPRFAPTHRGLGLVHERAGQKALAVRSLETYLRLSPGAPDEAAIRARIERLSR